MKKDKKILKSASMIAGALLTTTLATTPALGADILAYNDLGTGSQVRSHLIQMNSNQVDGQTSNVVKFAELKCGEGKCGEGDKKEAKKGETTKTEATAATAAESKSAEAKCGEGKCGEGEKKEAAKTETTKKKKSDK